MRKLTDLWFSDFLLRVGNGVEEKVDGSYIRIADDMVIAYRNEIISKDALIDAIFSLHINGVLGIISFRGRCYQQKMRRLTRLTIN